MRRPDNIGHPSRVGARWLPNKNRRFPSPSRHGWRHDCCTSIWITPPQHPRFACEGYCCRAIQLGGLFDSTSAVSITGPARHILAFPFSKSVHAAAQTGRAIAAHQCRHKAKASGRCGRFAGYERTRSGQFHPSRGSCGRPARCARRGSPDARHRALPLGPPPRPPPRATHRTGAYGQNVPHPGRARFRRPIPR